MKMVVRALTILVIACVIGFGTYSVVQMTSAVPTSAAMAARERPALEAGGQQFPYGKPYGASHDGSAPNGAEHRRPGGGSGNKLVPVLLVLAKFSGVFAVVAIAAALVRRLLGQDKKRGAGVYEDAGEGQC